MTQKGDESMFFDRTNLVNLRKLEIRNEKLETKNADFYCFRLIFFVLSFGF
jgi:hypothetical protein